MDSTKAPLTAQKRSKRALSNGPSNTGKVGMGSADDCGFSARKRATDAVPSFAAHHKDAAHSGCFEPFEILGYTPRNFVPVSDNTILAHCGDRFPGGG